VLERFLPKHGSCKKGVIATLVGVPKEIKDHEYRVGLIPSTVRELVSKRHRVLV
jgi:hypothetical protein